jgi:DNA-binding response OmpR family regulator
MLTGRGGEDDRVHGLDTGADDYLPKTSSSRELLSRIRALLRRSALVNRKESPASITVGLLKIDGAARTAYLGEQMLVLTPIEFDLLIALAGAAGSVRSREFLLEQLCGRQLGAFDRSIDVHIAALRRKLGDDPSTPRYIHTVRGAGYKMVDPDS